MTPIKKDDDVALVDVSPTEQRSRLFAALSAARLSFEPLKFNRTNPHFKSRYADLGAVLESTSEALIENGLSFTQYVGVRFGDAGHCQPILITLLVHKDGGSIESHYPLPAGQIGDPQKLGSAITYAKRYALSAILGLVAEEDDDGNASSSPPGGGRAAQPPSGAAQQIGVGVPSAAGPIPLPGGIVVDDFASSKAQWQAWALALNGAIMSAATTEDINAWMSANKEPLDVLHGQGDLGANLVKRLRENANKRLSEMNGGTE